MAVTRPLTELDGLQIPPVPQTALVLQLIPALGPPEQKPCVWPFGMGAGPSAVQLGPATRGTKWAGARARVRAPRRMAGSTSAAGCGSDTC